MGAPCIPPCSSTTLQQVKPSKFSEEKEEGPHVSGDDAQAYMEDHAVIYRGDNGPYVDRAQGEYVEAMRLGKATHELSQQYSQWSTEATVMLASKGESTLADNTKRIGYGQRVVFKLQKTKAPDEIEM
eukprot:6007609-Karenia_brevis.AAC.1